MFNKKTLILGAASVLLASGLAGCGGGAPADLKYWCPSVDNDVMEKLVEEFKKDNPDYASKNIVRDQNYGEGDTYKALHEDLENAADVMLMADDNIRSGVSAEEIASVDEDRSTFLTETGSAAVDSVSINGKMYGYPYRADNSPLPIYDKDIFTDTSKLNTLEGMLETCKAANKKFYLDMGNGWYNSFLIWAGGGNFSAGKKDGRDVILNNIAAKADDIGAVLETMKSLYNTYKSIWVSTSEAAPIEKGFKEGSIGVAFLWNDVATIRAAGGGNIGVTAWPDLKVGNGVVSLKCFRSYKAVVVKEQEEGERLTLAKAFAKYLANKKSQQARIELAYGPSNLELQATPEVKALEFAGVIQKMADNGRTVVQALSVTGDFWTPMGNLGTLIINGIADGDAKAWGDYPNAARAVKGVVAGASGWVNQVA